MDSIYIVIGLLVIASVVLFVKGMMDAASQADDKWLGDRQYEENIGVTIEEETTPEAFQKG